MRQNSPSSNDLAEARRGASAAFTVYLLWGTLPVYWKFLAVVAFQAMRGRFGALGATWGNSLNRRAHLRGGVLIAINWGCFVWALLNDRIIEASLGYFLVPLLNASLGRIIFKEQLDGWQKAALALAGLGVVMLFTQIENPPWMALGIAGSWSLYGVGRKQSSASAINGLGLEMGFVAPAALAFLIWTHTRSGGSAAFGGLSLQIDLLLAGTGIMTMIPLVLFAYATRRLTYTTIGLLQYVAPTCQFLIGWLIFGESFSGMRVFGFTLIWVGLVCYVYSTLRAHRAAAARITREE